MPMSPMESTPTVGLVAEDEAIVCDNLCMDRCVGEILGLKTRTTFDSIRMLHAVPMHRVMFCDVAGKVSDHYSPHRLAAIVEGSAWLPNFKLPVKWKCLIITCYIVLRRRNHAEQIPRYQRGQPQLGDQ